MSLAEKWNEYRRTLPDVYTPIELRILQGAFYAGAEAALGSWDVGHMGDTQAEIDAFKKGTR